MDGVAVDEKAPNPTIDWLVEAYAFIGTVESQSALTITVGGQVYALGLGSQVGAGLQVNRWVTGTAYACPDGKQYIVDLQADDVTAYYTGTYAYDAAGRLEGKDGMTLNYSSAHPHAVQAAAITSTVQVALAYNHNGDVITRTLSSGETLAFTYTREHKVEKVYRNGAAAPEHWFAYGPDGERKVEERADGTIIFYVGRHYEYSQNDTEVHQTQYYPEAGAMRVDGVLFYVLSDHLGSTSLVTDAAGNKLSESRYDAWGQSRYISGDLPTDRRYTGQRLSEDLGLYDYRARWYDPLLGRFLMEDTLIAPQGVMSLDGYSYAKNAPVVFVDPSGNVACNIQEECEDMGITSGGNPLGSSYVPLTLADNPSLTEDGANAKELYKYYKTRYQICPRLGNCWDKQEFVPFTVFNFFILILGFEFSPYIYGAPSSGTSRQPPPPESNLPTPPTFEEDLAHSTTHGIWSKCANNSGQECKNLTINDVFNYVGTLGSARERFKVIDQMRNGTYREWTTPNITLATQVANQVFNPPNPEWKRSGSGNGEETYVSLDEPWSWGNGSMLGIELRKITKNDYLWILPGPTLEQNAYLFTIRQCRVVGCAINK